MAMIRCGGRWSVSPARRNRNVQFHPTRSGPVFRPESLPSWSMSRPWLKIVLVAGGVLLLGAFTAEFWARALADAVIGQVVVPLARLIADLVI